ncbi:protein POLYCHOME-like isoform X2 [Amaranthus tricolor]|uniref:protein POLYCHOME-like isoform X2 n=1 Tax=Amaranthus tricolor TaxID=29722 RepID=UPI00258993B0|nr:protein POLYCHOME-like isoform X2 [Amaranthus tricolor]
MPIPSRDRLPRPVDISSLYKGAARRVDLIVDIPGLRWAGLSGHGPRRTAGVRGGRQQGWIHQRPLVTGQGNRAPRSGGGRGRGSGTLPYWYPRAPLRDVTAIAIESRRAELNQTTEEASLPQENTNAEAMVASTSELDQQVGSSTPLPVSVKSEPFTATHLWKTPRIRDNKDKPLNFLTPQKRLLDSIEKVREIWLEDQKKLARTPAAKKAEREKKVRTLMSMR